MRSYAATDHGEVGEQIRFRRREIAGTHCWRRVLHPCDETRKETQCIKHSPPSVSPPLCCSPLRKAPARCPAKAPTRRILPALRKSATGVVTAITSIAIGGVDTGTTIIGTTASGGASTFTSTKLTRSKSSTPQRFVAGVFLDGCDPSAARLTPLLRLYQRMMASRMGGGQHGFERYSAQ